MRCCCFPGLTAAFVFGHYALWITPLATVAAALLFVTASSRRASGLILRPINRLLGGGGEQPTALGLAGALTPTLLLMLAGVVGATALHAVAVIVGGWPWQALGTMLFVYGAATLAGYAIPFLPAGGLAREAAIVALLAPTMGPATALSVAVVSRALSIVADATVGLSITLGILGA